MKNVAVVMMKNENKYIFYIIFHCSWILFYYSNDVKKEWNSSASSVFKKILRTLCFDYFLYAMKNDSESH